MELSEVDVVDVSSTIRCAAAVSRNPNSVDPSVVVWCADSAGAITLRDPSVASKVVYTIPPCRTEYVFSICHVGNSAVWAGYSSGRIRIYALDGGLLNVVEPERVGAFVVHDLHHSPSGVGGVFAALSSGDVVQYDAVKRTVIRTFTGHTSPVRCVACVGHSVFAGSEDLSIRVWNCSNGKLLALYTDLPGAVLSLCHCYMSSTVWAGHEEGSVSVWDASSLAHLRTFSAHTAAITTLSCGGQFVLSASADRSVRLWDAGSFHLAAKSTAHTEMVCTASLVERRTDVHCWTLGEEGLVRRWNVRCGGSGEAIVATTSADRDQEVITLHATVQQLKASAGKSLHEHQAAFNQFETHIQQQDKRIKEVMKIYNSTVDELTRLKADYSHESQLLSQRLADRERELSKLRGGSAEGMYKARISSLELRNQELEKTNAQLASRLATQGYHADPAPAPAAKPHPGVARAVSVLGDAKAHAHALLGHPMTNHTAEELASSVAADIDRALQLLKQRSTSPIVRRPATDAVPDRRSRSAPRESSEEPRAFPPYMVKTSLPPNMSVPRSASNARTTSPPPSAVFRLHPSRSRFDGHTVSSEAKVNQDGVHPSARKSRSPDGTGSVQRGDSPLRQRTAPLQDARRDPNYPPPQLSTKPPHLASAATRLASPSRDDTTQRTPSDAPLPGQRPIIIQITGDAVKSLVDGQGQSTPAQIGQSRPPTASSTPVGPPPQSRPRSRSGGARSATLRSDTTEDESDYLRPRHASAVPRPRGRDPAPVAPQLRRLEEQFTTTDEDDVAMKDYVRRSVRSFSMQPPRVQYNRSHSASSWTDADTSEPPPNAGGHADVYAVPSQRSQSARSRSREMESVDFEYRQLRSRLSQWENDGLGGRR